MVSSRDRIRQRSFLISSKLIARTPPPAFLFPFNNVKDPAHQNDANTPLPLPKFPTEANPPVPSLEPERKRACDL
jgi:hypothetical protein